MQDTESTPDLLTLVARQWQVILGTTVAVVAIAFALTSLQEDTYSATASLLFSDQSPALALPGESADSSVDPERLAATMVELVSGREVVDRTADELGRTPASVESSVTVESEGVSNVLTVTATDSAPEGAATLADTYSDQYIVIQKERARDQLRKAKAELTRRLATLTPEEEAGGAADALRQRLNELVAAPISTGAVQVASSARVPTSPSSPDMKVNLFLGLVVGVLLGLVLAYVRHLWQLGLL